MMGRGDFYFLAAIIGYLAGSIPFGLLLTRAAGLGDIREIGSGNIGATNVLRTGNKKIAAATLLLDGVKGAAAALACGALISPRVMAVCGFAAVAGHCFPVWLALRGGKGVATGLGVFLALCWPAGLIACAVWLIGAKLTKISSAGALAAFVAGPLAAFGLSSEGRALACAGIAAIVFFRHRENIARILAGTEPRIGKKA